jgi:hypothetical protein
MFYVTGESVKKILLVLRLVHHSFSDGVSFTPTPLKLRRAWRSRLLFSLLFFVVPVVGMQIQQLKSWTREDKVAALFGACAIGNFELVKGLVEEDKCFLEATDSGCGDTPLIRACFHGKIEIVDYLLNQGAQPEAKNNYKATGFYYAVVLKNSNLNLIKCLINHGANMNSKVNGANVLHNRCRTFSVSEGNDRKSIAECIEYLLEEGVKFDEKDDYGRMPYDILKPKDRHALREKFDCKSMKTSKVLLVDLGHKYDEYSILNELPDDIMREIRKNSVKIGLPSSAQAQIWKPVSRQANEEYNKLYNAQYDLSDETINIDRILTWSKEERVAVSAELMRIENSIPVGL